MSGEFVAEYVQECLQNGVKSPIDIRKCAEEDIELINDEIQKIELLRGKQSNLRAVVRYMGGGAKAKNVSIKNMDFSMSWDELDDSYKILCKAICKFIHSSEKRSPREIMDAVRVPDDPRGRAVYSAIKWLEHHDIIDRVEVDDGSAVVFVAGSAWDMFSRGNG